MAYCFGGLGSSFTQFSALVLMHRGDTMPGQLITAAPAAATPRSSTDAVVCWEAKSVDGKGRGRIGREPLLPSLWNEGAASAQLLLTLGASATSVFP